MDGSHAPANGGKRQQGLTLGEQLPLLPLRHAAAAGRALHRMQSIGVSSPAASPAAHLALPNTRHPRQHTHPRGPGGGAPERLCLLRLDALTGARRRLQRRNALLVVLLRGRRGAALLRAHHRQARPPRCGKRGGRENGAGQVDGLPGYLHLSRAAAAPAAGSAGPTPSSCGPSPVTSRLLPGAAAGDRLLGRACLHCTARGAIAALLQTVSNTADACPTGCKRSALCSQRLAGVFPSSRSPLPAWPLQFSLSIASGSLSLCVTPCMRPWLLFARPGRGNALALAAGPL